MVIINRADRFLSECAVCCVCSESFYSVYRFNENTEKKWKLRMNQNIQTRRATFDDIQLIAFLYIWLLIRATLEEEWLWRQVAKTNVE